MLNDNKNDEDDDDDDDNDDNNKNDNDIWNRGWMIQIENIQLTCKSELFLLMAWYLKDENSYPLYLHDLGPVSI